MSRSILKIFRVIAFLLIILLELGAFLSEEYLATLGGIVACMMLTVSPSYIQEKFNINAFGFYIIGILIFLIFSYIDMIN